MAIGKCYKLFTDLKSHIEAKMKCKAEDAMLSNPKTYPEKEFIKSFIKHENSSLLSANIWLDARRSDIATSVAQYVLPYSALSDGNLNAETGDCLSIKIDAGENKGVHRLPCNEGAFFICEKSDSVFIFPGDLFAKICLFSR